MIVVRQNDDGCKAAQTTAGGARRGRSNEQLAARREAELSRVGHAPEVVDAEAGRHLQESNLLGAGASVDPHLPRGGVLHRAGQIAEPRRRRVGRDDHGRVPNAGVLCPTLALPPARWGCGTLRRAGNDETSCERKSAGHRGVLADF